MFGNEEAIVMIEPPGRAKYNQLRVAVQSYTEGFTSIMWPAFGDLASYARCSDSRSFEIDFLRRMVLPSVPISADFFGYRDLSEWFDAIGCSVSHVARFQMKVDFDPSSAEDFRWAKSSESLMEFHAHTEIESDQGQIYQYDYHSKVWFDCKRA